MKKGRLLGGIAAAVAIAALIAGCSAHAKSQVVTIKFFAAGTQYEKGGIGAQDVQAFMKANPNIKVDLTYAPGRAYINAFATMLSAGLPDVFQYPGGGNVMTFLGEKAVQPLDTTYFKNSKVFPAGSFQNGYNAFNGKVYSFPIWTPNIYYLAYNKTVMKKAGLDPNKPPTTWKELLAMSLQVAKYDPGAHGLVVPMSSGNNPQIILSWANDIQPGYTSDTPGFDLKTGSYSFDSPAVIQSVEFMTTMLKEGALDPNALTYGNLQAEGAFANNQDAFYPMGSWGPEQLSQLNKNLDYGVSYIPAPKSSMKPVDAMSPASTYFWLSSTTKHQAAAEKLIEWFTTPEYFVQQTNEMFYPAPNAEELLAQGKITSEPLKEMVRTYAKVNVIPPNPSARPGVAETRAIEATLATPSPNWNQIMEGAIGGRLPDWQNALAKVTKEYNARLAQAIKKEDAKGGKVTQKDFAFPSWSGTRSYSGT